MDKKSGNKKGKMLFVLGVICFAIALFFIARGVILAALLFFTLSSVFPIFAVEGKAEEQQPARNDVVGERMVLALQDRLDEAKDENRVLKERIEELSMGNDVLHITSDEKDEETADALAASILPRGEGDDAIKQTLDITKVIKEAAHDFRAAAVNAGVEIRVIEPAEPMYVSAAPIMLRTMFRDIIDNAVKYMKRSGSLQVTIANLDDDIFVAMKDNGEGLSESETVHIFELNYQGSNRISGNGLGLAQVKAIVDYYGGMIYAKSSPGRGMGIYLHLPAERK
ncbi:MAG: HAMP domain-containing histidine kinase [Lachnospiraceae bacterium]|nr:HAMP domain-containing histidine kinase [Lachnospiraceae bacterium]